MRAAFRTLRILPIVTALGLTLGAGSAPVAFAQDTAQDRVEEELDRTDRALENASDVVGESHSQRAKDLLNQGHRVQAQARQSFSDKRPVVALRLTLEARRLGVRAVGFARSDDSLGDRARRELEIADTMLRTALEEVATGQNDAAMRLLDEARAQIDRGRRQLGEQHYEAAFRLALSAQRLVRQALELNNGVGGVGRAERELERTDAVLERVRGPIEESGQEDAILLLSRAVQLQGSAWEAFRGGQPRIAIARTREARQLASRALARVHGPVSEERVIDEIGNTDRVLEKAQETVEASGAENARRLLESARSHQERATQLMRGNELRSALAQTLVARRLAARAEDLTREPAR
jgi:tetratricopeptide (TPR) repeat protein